MLYRDAYKAAGPALPGEMKYHLRDKGDARHGFSSIPLAWTDCRRHRRADPPGRQGGGWIATLILGVIGALLGGWIGGMVASVDYERVLQPAYVDPGRIMVPARARDLGLPSRTGGAAPSDSGRLICSLAVSGRRPLRGGGPLLALSTSTPAARAAPGANPAATPSPTTRRTRGNSAAGPPECPADQSSWTGSRSPCPGFLAQGAGRSGSACGPGPDEMPTRKVLPRRGLPERHGDERSHRSAEDR